MKRFATALAIATAVFASSGVVYAQACDSCDDTAASFTWDGSTDGDWFTPANWTAGAEWPGFNGQSPWDSATLADDTDNSVVVLDSEVCCSLASVLIDATAAGGSMQLTVTTGSTVDVDGEITVKGGTAAGAKGTLLYDGGTFTVDSFNLDGGARAAKAAVLDIDANLNLSGSSTDIEADWYSDIDVEAGDTFTVDAVTVNASTGYARLRQYNGTGELDAQSLTITAGDAVDEDAEVLVSAGTFDVNGPVTLNALIDVDAIAKVEVSSGANFTPDSFVLNGGDESGEEAVLDFDENVQTSTSTSVDGRGRFEIADGKWFDAEVMTLGAAGTYLTVVGEDTDSILRYTSLATNGRKMTFTGPLTVECD